MERREAFGRDVPHANNNHDSRVNVAGFAPSATSAFPIPVLVL